jgi:hypothetical protein
MPIMQESRYVPPVHMIMLTEKRDHALRLGLSAALTAGFRDGS